MKWNIRLFLSERRTVQDAEKDQLIDRADGVIFARIEYEERVGSASLLGAIAASKDALPL